MTTLLTPLNSVEAEYIQLGEKEGVFWKQIIPIDHTINYNGRVIKFDKEKLDSIKDAYNAKINDQTAFQLANDDNEHDTSEDVKAGRNFDPQRYRGEVTQFSVNNRGLYAKFNLTAEGAKLIQANPKLSVSASLKENVEHEGKTYPMVCRHILGTLDARIKGMSPWSKDDIGLSNEDGTEEVIDLAEGDDTKVEDTTPNNGETVTVPKEQWDSVLAFVNKQKEEDEALENLVKEEDNKEPELVNNSNTPDPKLIELSNSVAGERFERRADTWRREGVPNKMIELARPVLSAGDDFSINLSNGNSVDAKAVISSIIDEAKGTIDLTSQNTSQRSQQEEDEEANAIKALDEYLAGF